MKQNNRKTGARERHKAKLRLEAEERAVARSKRSTQEQLALLDSRRGLSVKERRRLGQEIEK